MKEKMKDSSWKEIIGACFRGNIDLTARHMYNISDGPKSYNVWGVAATEVEVDVLTGQLQVVRTDLIEDAGQSMSPAVDIGQVEGAFVMGMGLWTMEELKYNPDTGRLLTNGTWTYHIPGAQDIPADFRVNLLKNAPNPYGVLGSKTTGEPPLCLSVAILFALRDALYSARADAGETGWFQFNGPATLERIHRYSLTQMDQFKL